MVWVEINSGNRKRCFNSGKIQKSSQQFAVSYYFS